MKIIILGGSGMLGHRLWINLRQTHQTWVTLRSDYSRLPDIEEFPRDYVIPRIDGASTDAIAGVMAAIKPEVVINCIGIIKQAELAKDPLSSIMMNALFPHRLALICRAAGARMIHISTDCVFSGKKGNYREDDPSDAVDLYGRTKFLGEVSYPHTLTLRTSIVGRELAGHLGLIDWLLSQQQTIRGYRKAIYSGLTTDEFSRVVLEHVLPRPDLNGVLHLSGNPITKYDLLLLVREAFRRSTPIVPDDDFVCDRSLDSTRFRQETGYVPPVWPQMIDRMALSESFYERLGG